MTDFPAPDSPPEPKWPARLAWIVILATVGLIIAAQYIPEIRGKKKTPAANNLQVELLGKYVVGYKSAFPQQATQPASIESIQKQLEAIEHSPRQTLRETAVLGELKGAPAALETLKKIGPATQPAIVRDADTLTTIYTKSPRDVDADARSGLIARNGFYGKLALVFGLPDSDPERAAVLSTGKQVIFALIGWFCVMVLLFLVGLGLLITVLVLWCTGSMRPRFNPPVHANSAYLEAFAMYLVLYTFVPALVLKFLKVNDALMWSFPAILILPLVMWYARWRGNDWPDVLSAFGWQDAGWWYVEAPLGVLSYLAGIPVMLLGLMITGILVKFSGATPTHPIIFESQDSAGKIVALYLLACVWAPVFEESMFRGALFAHLRRRHGWWMSATPVALIFASIHPQGWTTIPLLGSIAMVLAAVREWRGSIIASIVCHGCVNFATVTLLVLLNH